MVLPSLAFACLSSLGGTPYGYPIGTLLYTYCISTDYLPYPYAAPTRAMQGVTSYKSLVLILIHGDLLKWI